MKDDHSVKKKMFYKYDIKTGKYLRSSFIAEYCLNGKLIEGFTDKVPPICPEGNELYFEDGKWVIKEKPKDYRGKWMNKNGKVIIINKLGEKPPKGFAKKENGNWYYLNGDVAFEVKAYEEKKEKINQLNEKINSINKNEKLLEFVERILSGENLSKLILEYSKWKASTEEELNSLKSQLQELKDEK